MWQDHCESQKAGRAAWCSFRVWSARPKNRYRASTGSEVEGISRANRTLGRLDSRSARFRAVYRCHVSGTWTEKRQTGTNAHIVLDSSSLPRPDRNHRARTKTPAYFWQRKRQYPKSNKEIPSRRSSTHQRSGGATFPKWRRDLLTR